MKKLLLSGYYKRAIDNKKPFSFMGKTKFDWHIIAKPSDRSSSKAVQYFTAKVNMKLFSKSYVQIGSYLSKQVPVYVVDLNNTALITVSAHIEPHS